jgi:hypothetical protein
MLISKQAASSTNPAPLPQRSQQVNHTRPQGEPEPQPTILPVQPSTQQLDREHESPLHALPPPPPKKQKTTDDHLLDRYLDDFNNTDQNDEGGFV